MRARAPHQELERRDPAVDQWLAECGIAIAPCSLRLVSTEQSALLVQRDRLARIFGKSVTFGEPRRGRDGGEWILYGTLTS